MTNVAINGLGRIGRATLKIVMDTPGLDLVAANDLGTSDDVADLMGRITAQRIAPLQRPVIVQPGSGKFALQHL